MECGCSPYMYHDATKFKPNELKLKIFVKLVLT